MTTTTTTTTTTTKMTTMIMMTTTTKISYIKYVLTFKPGSFKRKGSRAPPRDYFWSGEASLEKGRKEGRKVEEG
jgi:hypothetical protein